MAAFCLLGGGGGVESSGGFPGRIPASWKERRVAGHPGVQAAAKHLANPHGQEKRKEGKNPQNRRLGFPVN